MHVIAIYMQQVSNNEKNYEFKCKFLSYVQY